MPHVPPEVALAITRQKARYGRGADTKNWPLFESVALPDARYSYNDINGNPIKRGKQELVFDSIKSASAFFQKLFVGRETMHNIGGGDFELVAPDEVKAVFPFEDHLLSESLGSWLEISGGGFYYETWKEVDGEWYIQELRMVRSFQRESVLAAVALALAEWLNISL